MQIYWENIFEKLLVHIEYSFLAILASIVIGISIGVMIYKTRIAKVIFISWSSILQVIPSIAIFGLLLPFVDNLAIIIIITLVSYGIFPILSNTVVALNDIEDQQVDSAKSLGLNRFQILFRIRFMGSLGTIINGIRITSVLLIGGASIAFVIGGGGLGEIINQGIQTQQVGTVLQGAIPIILLALTTISLLTLIKYAFTERGSK